jgi:hypothetical protein
MDFVYVAAIVAFLALSCGLAAACEQLGART